ncbi:hypothetical protein TH19_06915 [Thalassospira profundimaris]|uniref:YcaO domain-containing protein n=2 Tax=Thalassospira profundimaris TaxID=502049 RepID=A0A367W8J7_9PROT|nr:hypothetical protein TH19_06915 [Thalassospira profundimaris]
MVDDQKYLAIAPHFTLHAIGNHTYLLLSETQSFRLNGERYGILFPYLDGRLREQEIIAGLGDRIPPADISEMIAHMRKRGYVVAIDPWADHARSAYWSANALQPDECESFAQSIKLAVVGLGRDGAAGSVQASELAAMLMAQGFSITDFKNANLTIVLTEDYLQPALSDFARMAAKRKMAWVPFKPGGLSAWFGPVIGADGGAGNCYFCLARRLAEHRQGDTVAPASPEGARPARAFTKASLAVAFGRVVLDTVRLSFGQCDDLRTKLQVWSLSDGVNEQHGVPLFTDCPEHMPQSGPQTPDQMHRPITLSRIKNQDGADGGWRVLTPEQALARLEPIVSPLTGIVGHLHKADLGEGLHVYSASQGRRMSIDPRQNRSLGRPGGAAGKGLSDEQAKISCLAEAVERYGAQWSGSEPRHQASWQDNREHAPHPASLLDYAAQQYQNRESLNQNATVMARIPEPFDETAVIDWTPAWSLRDHAPRWVPTRFCYYEYRGDAPGDHDFCAADSNGCATGGSIEEAILQGFLELVERDAISIWWYNRLVPRRVSLDGLDDAFVAKMQAHYQSLGRTFWVIDLTTDLGIPVMIAASAKQDGSRILLGFGSHLDGRIAALRALTELNQILMHDDIEPSAIQDKGGMEDAMTTWLANENLADHPYIVGAGTEKSVDDLPSAGFDTIDQAVQFCVDRMAEEGFDTIVVDYSRQDLPLSCVRVVVPGLRHFWNRRAPGRLFDAPVKMGVLDHPHSYDDLHPLAFFL